jgi:iron complex outermembrane recepter protein
MFEYTTSGFAIALALLANANPALAQSEKEAANSDRDIIVTAQRRDESLAKTPVAVDVIGADELAKQNITTESDLQFAAPGLTVRVGANANEFNFAIRGQSVDQFAGTRPGVLPYFNEVQISSNSGGGGSTTAFYDLQSIQVLKGPQGTLFGRNATGGAVLFATAKPVEGTSGYASARFGDYGVKQLEGAINIGGDTAKLRVAGFYGDQTGYQRNLFNNTRPGSLERYGLRGSLTLEGASIRNELVVDYYNASGSNTQSVLYSLDPTIGLATSSIYGPAYDTIVSAPGAWAGYVASRNNPEVRLDGITGFFSRQQARGPFTIATDSTNFYRAENIIVTNATIWDFGADSQIKNILGYARLESDVAGDSDGSPFTIAGADSNPNRGRPGSFIITEIFSNELQLSGKAVSGQLDYVTGLYYASENGDLRRESTFTDVFGGPITTNSNNNSNRTYSAFAQGTYDLSAKDGGNGLAITAGIRYTKEDISLTYRPDDSAFPTSTQLASGLYVNPQSKSEDNVSWMIGLQDQVNSTLLLYVKSRRSFRNGGFNGNQSPRVGGSATLGNDFVTERATDIEGGIKYQGDMGTVPTRLNLAVYNLWINQSQRNAFAFVAGVPSSLTVNVPTTKIYGFELDGQFSLSDWFSVGGNLNYTNAQFTNGLTNVNGSAVNFSTVPDTPKWSGAIYAEANVPVSGSMKLTLRGDLYAQTGTFFISTGATNPTAKLPGYSVANFRIGLSDPDAGWSLTANLKNAFESTMSAGSGSANCWATTLRSPVRRVPSRSRRASSSDFGDESRAES